MLNITVGAKPRAMVMENGDDDTVDDYKLTDTYHLVFKIIPILTIRAVGYGPPFVGSHKRNVE